MRLLENSLYLKKKKKKKNSPSYLHIQVDVDTHNTEFQVSSNHREDVGGDGLFQQIRAKLLSYNFLLPRLRPPQSS